MYALRRAHPADTPVTIEPPIFSCIPNLGNEGDDKHIDNFFDCMRTRQEPNCGASLGYTTMTHIGLAVRSYREGKMFHFDPVKEEVIERG